MIWLFDLAIGFSIGLIAGYLWRQRELVVERQAAEAAAAEWHWVHVCKMCTFTLSRHLQEVDLNGPCPGCGVDRQWRTVAGRKLGGVWECRE